MSVAVSAEVASLMRWAQESDGRRVQIVHGRVASGGYPGNYEVEVSSSFDTRIGSGSSPVFEKAILQALDEWARRLEI